MTDDLSTNTKKIGIMGGTFNPIHNAHIQIAQCAYEQFHLDMVLFMPANQPPHKDDAEIISNHLRGEMTRLAINNIKHFHFSDMELKREGYTYTVETLKCLLNNYPQYQLYFILGMDSLMQIEKWKGYQELLKLCKILIAGRGSSSHDEVEDRIDYLNKKYQAEIFAIDFPNMDISSTEIRNRLANGESIHELVPAAVEEFILKNHLYE